MRNRLRVRLRRLREPKYLIGTLIGVAYFGFIFFGRGRNRGPGLMWAINRAPDTAELVVAFFLFATTVLGWVWTRSKPALPFTLAEVQHLFPAPISRRDLVRYRLLRSQVGTLIGGAVMALIFRPGSGFEGLRVFVGVSLLMATLNFHMVGISLNRAQHGARRWIPLAFVAMAALIVGGTVVTNWGAMVTTARTGGDLAGHIERVGSTGAVAVILWPFRAIARVPMAESTSAFLMMLPAALALLALNYIWVLRSDAPFEEASAELSVKLDKIRRGGFQALRQPRPAKRTPFTLAPHGRPETAILWKNLISMGRVYSGVMFLRILPILLFAAMMTSRGRGDRADGLAALCVVGAAFTLLLGPQMARSDLRQDLTALATLKTWPIRGAALVRGAILAPACVLTAIVFLALTAAAVLSTNAPFATVATRWSLLAAALFIAPGIVLTQLLAQNGLAVTFPSWVAIGTNNRAGGIDVIGQRLLVMFAVVLALVVSLLPAAIVAGVGAGIVYLMTGTVPVVLAGALAGVTLVVEAFVGSELVGAVLERSDISVLDAPES